MDNRNEQSSKPDSQENGLLTPPASETKDIFSNHREADAILWRATFGGVAGYWLFLILLLVRDGDYRSLTDTPGLILVMIIENMPISVLGGAIGMLIGAGLRLYYVKQGRNLEIVARVGIGVCGATIINGIIWYSWYSMNAANEAIPFYEWLTSSTLAGGLSGLLARPRKDERPRRAA